LRGRFFTSVLTPISRRCSEPRSIRSITHSANLPARPGFGHIRLQCGGPAIGVPAETKRQPAVRRNKSTPPVSGRMPISPLLMSGLGSAGTRLPVAWSNRKPTLMRLEDQRRLVVVCPAQHDGGRREKAELPVGDVCRSAGSRCAQPGVTRFAPDTTLKGRDQPRGRPGHPIRRLISAESIAHRIIRRIAVDDGSPATGEPACRGRK